MINVVLIEPEIPQNTGNIARLCACTNSRLFLIGKLGFSMSNKYLKRSGLDYWDKVEIIKYQDLNEMKKDYPNSNFYYLTTKTNNIYTKTNFKDEDFIIFGPETRGIDEKILKENSKQTLTIPMEENTRSLNLSNSVAIVLYEAIRQIGKYN